MHAVCAYCDKTIEISCIKRVYWVTALKFRLNWPRRNISHKILLHLFWDMCVWDRFARTWYRSQQVIHYQSTLIHQVGNNRKKNDKTVLMSLTIDSRDTLSTALRVRTKNRTHVSRKHIRMRRSWLYHVNVVRHGKIIE